MPQDDGTVELYTFHRGTTTDYNTDVEDMTSRMDSERKARDAAKAQQAAAAATQRGEQEAAAAAKKAALLSKEKSLCLKLGGQRDSGNEVCPIDYRPPDAGHSGCALAVDATLFSRGVVGVRRPPQWVISPLDTMTHLLPPLGYEPCWGVYRAYCGHLLPSFVVRFEQPPQRLHCPECEVMCRILAPHYQHKEGGVDSGADVPALDRGGRAMTGRQAGARPQTLGATAA